MGSDNSPSDSGGNPCYGYEGGAAAACREGNKVAMDRSLPEPSTNRGRQAEVWCQMIGSQSSDRRLRFFDHLVSTRRRCPVTQIRTLIFGFFLLTGVTGVVLPDHADAASCDALVGKWAWFIGGEVTVNPDGTFTQQSGNAGTWQCTDPARGRFTLRWRDGGLRQQLSPIRPDGQGLTSTDRSQWYVTARRSAAAPTLPQLVRKDNCCQENYGCETKDQSYQSRRKWQPAIFPETPAASRKLRAGKPHSLKRPMNSSACATAPRAVRSPVKHRRPAARFRSPRAATSSILPMELAAPAKCVNRAAPVTINRRARAAILLAQIHRARTKASRRLQSKPTPTSPVVRDESDVPAN